MMNNPNMIFPSGSVVSEIVRALSVSRFEYRAVDTKRNAQANLSDKTHYVDDDTLRFHKSRILTSRAIANDSLFLITESCALDYQNRIRGFRCVVFDLTGGVVYRVPLDECYPTSKKAEKAFGDWYESFDVRQHYVDLIAHKATSLRQQADLLAKLTDLI